MKNWHASYRLVIQLGMTVLQRQLVLSKTEQNMFWLHTTVHQMCVLHCTDQHPVMMILHSPEHSWSLLVNARASSSWSPDIEERHFRE